MEEAQRVLEAFLPRFNRRFSVPPSVPGLAYRPIPPRMKLEEVFCFKYYRTVEADNVGALGDHRIQINPCHGRQSYNRARVEIQERMEGSLAVFYQGKCLITQPAPAEAPLLRVQKRGRLGSRESSASSELPTTKEKTPSPQKATSPYKPGPDHPWRKLWKRKTQRTDIFTGHQQRKIAFGNSLGFQVQIEDLRLKWCILGRNSKNNITGSNRHGMAL